MPETNICVKIVQAFFVILVEVYIEMVLKFYVEHLLHLCFTASSVCLSKFFVIILILIVHVKFGRKVCFHSL